MRINNLYKKQLKEGLISESLIGAIIYSYNKRAKMYRDKEYKYVYSNDLLMTQDEIDKLIKKTRCEKESMYLCKNFLLGLFKPVDITKEVCVESDGAASKKYYYKYIIGGRSFHYPIYDTSVLGVEYDIPVRRAYKHFETRKEYEDNLLALDFCNEVIKGLKCGKYKVKGVV